VKKPSGTDTYWYKPAEVDAIVNYCGQHAGLVWLGNVVTALASTGVRISELAALRWSDVDSDLHVLQIVDERHRRRRAGGEVRTTKTGQSRGFPIHVDLRRVLDSLTQSADGRIFHGPLGGRLHSFRHFFCSRYAQSGVPEQVVVSWLGHSSSQMVRHCFHLHDEESQRQMQRISFRGDAGGAVAAGNGS